MQDYAMMYENLVLTAWGKTWRREDPCGLGDADTFKAPDNNLSGRSGHQAKFGLSTAIMKLSGDNKANPDVYHELIELDEKLWSAKNINDLCIVLDETRALFEKLGLPVV